MSRLHARLVADSPQDDKASMMGFYGSSAARPALLSKDTNNSATFGALKAGAGEEAGV